MSHDTNPFLTYAGRTATQPDLYSESEVGLANRNSGTLLETLALDITPIGAHYLLNHFDVPIIDPDSYRLSFDGAFAAAATFTLTQIKAMPKITMPVTLECAGNGRAGHSPRSHSMPWKYEGVGTSEWTGTRLNPLIEQLDLNSNALEIAFEGADYGYDKACGHYFGRSLTIDQLRDLDVMLVYAMNGQPLLPQHGAPLRLIVPGWYGMASVKWLSRVTALTQAFEGFQQVRTYQFRQSDEDTGTPITTIRVKSLMVPPGVPDWISRKRLLRAGLVTLIGRAWSGAGASIQKVEVEINGQWQRATLTRNEHQYAWCKWSFDWEATPGHYILRCRATDEHGQVQPLTPPWDVSGFANNAVQSISVYVE